MNGGRFLLPFSLDHPGDQKRNRRPAHAFRLPTMIQMVSIQERHIPGVSTP